MTMHLVVGDGEMPKRDLIGTLDDLWEKAGDAEFWFTVVGKSEPTATDTALLDWITKSELYFEIIAVGDDEPSPIYATAQKRHNTKKLATKAINLLKTDEDDVDLLALFVNPAEDDPADVVLLETLEVVLDADIPAFALNDSMTAIDLSSGAEEAAPEAEEEEEAPPAKKAAGPTKKAAKKMAAPPVEEAEEDVPTTPTAYSRAELEAMDFTDVKATAAGLGISGRSQATLIERILEHQGGEGETQVEVEMEEQDTGSAYVSGATIEGPALLVIVLNGTVVARPINPEEALAMLASQ